MVILWRTNLKLFIFLSFTNHFTKNRKRLIKLTCYTMIYIILSQNIIFYVDSILKLQLIVSFFIQLVILVKLGRKTIIFTYSRSTCLFKLMKCSSRRPPTKMMDRRNFILFKALLSIKYNKTFKITLAH